ncbi:hypothetical protein [Selenomonas ruminantium]|uniref:hypothetical protein n=1 Tax=Selenomonas ruminantium TaxID=971 RepID=UPI0026EC0BDF|nr:hypothetical protein [Selenomonas ruminantium]
MLIDELVENCDKKYLSYGSSCGCESGVCNHPNGECSGSCYDCLYQIHFPSRIEGNKKMIYDCTKMLYHYVCQYSYLYTTEMLCAFYYKRELISSFSECNILSIGCGACADLMALEYILSNKNIPLRYYGVDINGLWMDIHNDIKNYCQKHQVCFNVYYSDAFDFFRQYSVSGMNIIVISYFISYLYNTGQIDKIDVLVDCLVNNVIKHKKKYSPVLLVINDVNSCNRGRDHFESFKDSIKRNGLHVKSEYRYFNTDRLNEAQKIGQAYDLQKTIFDIPQHIKEKYHAKDCINSSIQLLLEVL